MVDYENMDSGLLIQAYRECVQRITNAAGTPSMADSRTEMVIAAEIMRRMAW